MLVQFAFFAFGLFAVMSLVIDMGYVTLTRVQMQNAADSASLEGIRLRDKYATDGYASDCERRLAARDMVRYTFDNEFVVDDTPGADDDDPEFAFGAGPVMQVDGGEGELNAHQLMQLPDRRRDRVYKPLLQLNRAGDTQNLEYGDLVSGAFTYNSSAEHSEGSRTSSPQAAPYNRNDFNANQSPPAADPAWGPGYSNCPDPPVGQPLPPWPAHDPSYTGSQIVDDAFLVRLRRTNGRHDDLDAQTDVSSKGPSLKLLWGLGSTVQGDSVDPDSYPVRHEGFVVRGTAISRVAPTFRVGLPQGSARGATPFALRRSFYDSTLNDAFQDFGVTANGEIKNGATTVGQFASNPTSCAEPTTDHDRCTVGRIPPEPSAFNCTAAAGVDTSRAAYGSIYDLMTVSGDPKVIGFGWVNWTLDCATSTLSLKKRDITTVGTENTTGHLVDGLPAMTSQDFTDLQCTVCRFYGLQECTPPPDCPVRNPSIAVLSPVLGR